MSVEFLSRSARRFLMTRLERLHESLEKLGQRLREGIAQLVGTQVGEAIRDALETVLCGPLGSTTTSRPQPPPQLPPQNTYNYRDYHDYHDPYDHAEHQYEGQGYWRHEQSLPPEPVPDPKPSRWKSLLAGLAQLASWWLRSWPKRPSLRRVLGIGAVVGITTLVAGPLVGGMVMTIGTAVLLTRLSDGTTHVVGKLAAMPTD